jgi:hypothetical protein
MRERIRKKPYFTAFEAHCIAREESSKKPVLGNAQTIGI